ncbi:hypothetical protein DV735_g5112, partial [Chaetothyriales sp. CBS 134920]
MVDIARVRELSAAVESMVETYAQDSSTENYKQLQTAVSRLQIAAASPVDTLFSFRLKVGISLLHRTLVIGNIAVTMAMELGVIDALVALGQDQAHAVDLAAATGCEQGIIERLLRVACGLGICDEVDENTYRATEVTRLLVQPGWKAAMSQMDLIYPLASNARQYLSTTPAYREKQPPVSGATLFEYVHGKSMWQVLADNPDIRQNFDLWMSEQRRNEEETSWQRRYPPSTHLKPDNLKAGPEAVLMVDVGGAHGSQLVNFRSQFPLLPGQCVLQDLPESVGSFTNPPEHIKVMAYNFFTPQPIKGARFYYFRNVFHNWSDAKCIDILRNLVPAMDPDYSSVLIDDYVLPPTGAPLRSAIADVLMLIHFNSSERTSSHYQQLLAAAGLDLVAVYPKGPNEEAIIEARRWW